jgi:hypothetical protein
MSEQDIPPRDQTKTELMRRNQRAYDELVSLIDPLEDDQLSQIGPSGWAIKHHLAHLAAWQMGITALLQGRSRPAAMGMGDADDQGKDTDQINEIIYNKHAGISADQAKEKLRDAHEAMKRQIESMSNEDLFTPYKNFLQADGDGSEDPVLYWIVGNAYGHYDEHIEWIRQIMEEGS